MKKILFILAILGLSLGACDKIEEPYLEESGSAGPGPGPVEKVRKILLEEFTGHVCPNCPEATLLSQDLKVIYGEQLVLMSIHAGALSVPGDAPFQADYRTAAGTQIYNFYSPIGVPTGLVNRTEYQGSTVLFKDKWEGAIQELIDIPPDAFIEIETEYDDASRKLDIHVHTEFLQDLDFSCNLSIMITESGMVSAQLNDLPSIGPDVIEDYEHNDVLRQGVNGSWGDLLAESPSAGTTMTKDYSITLNSEWDENNISVIALVLNTNTFEVVQAEEFHIQ
jgi:hypothetical protein